MGEVELSRRIDDVDQVLRELLQAVAFDQDLELLHLVANLTLKWLRVKEGIWSTAKYE